MGQGREPGVPRRKVLMAVAAGAAACALAGAGLTTAAGSGEPGPSPSPTRAAAMADVGIPEPNAVSTVLANRARAVRDRDRTAFLSTVAFAPAAYRQAQAAMFDNLLKMPLEGWQERVERVESTDGGAALVRIQLRYRLRDQDPAPVTRTRHLAFAPRSGTWVITGDGAARGRPDDAEIWDGGPLTVVRGRSTLVIGDAPGVADIARRLEAAVPAVTAVLGRSDGGKGRVKDADKTGAGTAMGMPPRVVAFVPADGSRAAALTGGGRDLHDIAALATAMPTADGTGADRIVIAPDAFERLNTLGRDVVLTHELAHVATGGARDGRTPLWLIEGFADYVGYRGRKVSAKSAARELHRDVAAGRIPAALPDRAAFDAGADGLAQSYQAAWLACRMIAERYGETALIRLYRTAGRMPESAALHEVLGVRADRFTAAWRDYLRKELR
ncbi:hypothetical protein ACFY4C_00500 [Actinomadura viridis]|uniref:hypothetical protein n=1 Tax=Actinomadura viridis TaxID=58110 RepID=UPI00367D7317